MEERFLSDEQIAAQYAGFKVTESSCEKLRYSDGFTGYLCIDFPNADHPDFNGYVCDNWISYDSDGKQIAFDNWYPDDVNKLFCEKIREEIKKFAISQ